MVTLTLAEASDRVRFTLIQAGLDRISQGFTVFDRDLRLIGWNRTFFELLEFPLEMAQVGRPFADFMRLNAMRGEYGPGDVEGLVAERVAIAHAFRPHQMERQRPDGRILSVRGEPLMEGGFVTIYTDVTDQRHYERLIREQNELLEVRVRERTLELEATNDQLRRAYTEQKRAEAALVHAQKLEAVGKLTGGLAHDFNNLLTIIIGNLTSVEESNQTEIAEYVRPALGAARRGVDLIQRLLAFARQKPLEPIVIDVSHALAGLFPLIRRSVPASIDVVLSACPVGSASSCVDPNQLDNAVLNLVLNARDAMPQGGRLTISCALHDLSEDEGSRIGCAAGSYVQISVEDTGTGMDEATLAKAFEPFFTSKEFGRSSGLGLSMVYGFARESKGDIRLTSKLGQGTQVKLLLPSSASDLPDSIGETLNAVRIETAPSVVLLVEDELEVRRVVRRQLQSLGHVVIDSGTADDALALLERTHEISVVVSDIVMPGGISGVDLALETRTRRPDVKVVLMTGYAGPLTETSDVRLDWPLLKKPFSTTELANALNQG